MSAHVRVHHCYFLLGMIFEKTRSSSHLKDMQGILLLSQAIFLAKKIDFAPTSESIWAYLLDMNIPSKKEIKKVHFLFTLVDILRESEQFTYAHFSSYTQRLSSFQSSLRVPTSPQQEIETASAEQSLLEEIFTTLEKYQTHYHFRRVQGDFYISLLLSILLIKNKITPHPLVQLSFNEKNIVLENCIPQMEHALTKALQLLEQVEKAISHIEQEVRTFGRVEHSAHLVVKGLFKKPLLSCKSVQQLLKIAKPNAQILIDKCVQHGILELQSTGERNRIYGVSTLLHIFGLKTSV